MSIHRVQIRTLLCAIFAVLFFVVTSSATAGTWELASSGGSYTGSMTFAVDGDSSPVAFSLVSAFNPGADWDQNDSGSPISNCIWGPGPVLIACNNGWSHDTVAPGATGGASVMYFGADGCGLNSMDTFSQACEVQNYTEVIAPPVPSGGSAGIALLVSLLGLAGIRKLRA
jgi:hypothetical protein